MKKVLLINPPLTCYRGSAEFDLHFPVGLMYLAAFIRDICKVEIFDCLVHDFKAKDANSITHGASPEEIRNLITNKKPDIVGISVHSTAQYKNAETVAKIAKQVNPKTTVIFGGPDPSVRYESILKNDYCDYCVVGDGEETLFEFVSNHNFPENIAKIKGLAQMSNGNIYFEPRVFDSNLDYLPFPAYDLIETEEYLKNKKLYQFRSEIHRNSTTIITSRGCPNSCVFCSVKLHMGQKYRSHSPEYVIKLIRYCKEKYGITNFHFEDDNLTCDINRFEKIIDLIIKEGLQIKWDTPNGVRVDTLNFSLLKKMKKSGCIHLFLAIESGNQRVLDEIIHKHLNLNRVNAVARDCKKLKIAVTGFYVIGFPGEKISEIIDTTNLAIDLYKRYYLTPALMLATPLYGTELYHICRKNNLIDGEPSGEQISTAIQSENGKLLITTPDFSKEIIESILDNYKKRLHGTSVRLLMKNPFQLMIALLFLVKTKAINGMSSSSR